MADGTVRGGFELNTEQAIRGLRSIRDSGREADQTLQTLGRRMDSFATTSTRVASQVSSSWGQMRRRIDTDSRAIETRLDGLEARMDRFARKRVSVTIELDGFDRVNAQISELEARLDRLGSRSVTSRVSLGGGFGNVTGGAGGAGGQGGLWSSLGGRAGLLPWWAAAAPLAPQLLGAAGGLLGSAGSAALGAGAVGVGAAGTLGLGAGLSMGVIKPAVTQLTDLVKLQTAYNTALQEFGKQSAQAVRAQRNLNQAQVTAGPNAIAAARQVSLLRSDWTRATAPGRNAFYGGLSQSAFNIRSGIAGGLGADANMASSATAGGMAQLTGYLTNSQAIPQYRALTASFSAELPVIVSSVGNLQRTFLNLAVAAIPFFHEADTWVNHWSTGLRDSTSNTVRVRTEMDKMVTSAKDWGHMLGAGGRVLKDLFSPGVQSGDSMIVQFTHTLDRWDTWLRDNPGKVRQFMDDGARGFSRIATTVSNLVGDIWKIFQGLSPILSRAEQFMQFASGLGGGNLLTGAGLLYGAYGGAQRALGGGGPSAGRAAGAFIFGGAGGAARTAARMGGGSTVGGSAATETLAAAEGGAFLMPRSGFQSTPGVYSQSGWLGGSSAAAAGASGQLPLFAAMAGGGYAYRAASLGRGLARGPGAFNAAYGDVAGARYAMPVSELGVVPMAERGGMVGMAAKGAGAMGGAARGAAMILLPLAAIQGALAGINTSGGPAHAINAGISTALSTLTFGAASPRGIEHVLHSAFGTDNAGASIGTAGPALQRLAAQASAVRTPQQMRAVYAASRFQPYMGSNMSPADSTRMQLAMEAATRTAASNAGAFASNTWQTAFTTALAHGKKPEDAIKLVMSGMQSQITALGPRGGRAFASDTAQWAAQMSQSDAKLQGPMDKMMGGIIHNLNALSHQTGTTMQDIRDKVFYFNGQILQGSQTTWKAIGAALTDPAQVAQEKLLGIFGQIQSEAINALVGMGFSKGTATGIVTAEQKGGAAAAGANSIVNLTLAGGVNNTLTGPGGTPRKHARGGIIGGAGLLDTVDLPDGSRAAPGEAWIANRHTMMDLSAATVEKFGKTAWEMIRDESRPHSQPMHALGGHMTGQQSVGSVTASAQRSSVTGWVQRQHPELHPGIAAAVEQVLNRYPLSITSTTRTGGHSYHALGEAADIAGDSGTMYSAANWIGSSGLYRSLIEGIHNPNLSISHGNAVSPGFWGGPTWAAHANHIHMAVGADGIGALGAGGLGAIGGGSVSLRALRSGLRGVPGALADRGSQIYAAALQSKINARIGGMGGAGGMSAAGWSGGGSQTANQALGHRMMLAAGWGEDQWPSLAALWNQESGWNANAVNPSSGAYGIPQALGHGHPYGLGDAPAQIAWGLNYIRGRYGSPAGAEAHERANNWYSRGGRWAGWNELGGSWVTNGPTTFGAGEKGRERVTITPVGAGRHGGHGDIHVHFEGPLFGSPAEIDRIGREVAAKILTALNRVGQGTSDSELAKGAA